MSTYASPTSQKTTLATPQNRVGFWDEPLGYPQAFVTVVTALIIGLFFHVRIGYRVPIPFSVVAWGGGGYALGLALVASRGRKRPLIKWVSGVPFAITVIVATGFVALIGAVVPASVLAKTLGVPSLFSSYPFWMLLFLMQTNLIAVTARRTLPLTRKNISFVASHLSLILIIFGGGLSGVSLERNRLLLSYGQANHEAITQEGARIALPFSMTLRNFKLESFPPTLALTQRDVHAKEGLKTTPGTHFLKPGQMEQIGDYRVRILQYLPGAALVGDRWIATNLPTAAPAAQIEAKDIHGKDTFTGWVSCGSVDTAGAILPLSGESALVMPSLRPKEYRASLSVSEQGKQAERELRVNHPLSIGDYRLYLLSYDEKMGAASEYVLVEVVRDHGIAVVYAGMYLMLGAVALMLWNGVGLERKEGQA